MRFAHPYFLLLLALVPFLAILYRRRFRAKKSGIRYSSIGRIKAIAPSGITRLRPLPFTLRIFAILLLIFAIARPQTGQGYREITREGIDIYLALDTSTSMDIMDMQPSRLEAAKNAISRFIGNRVNDRIGLILFAGTSFTRCPLTLDYDVLRSFIAPVHSGLLEDGTAIGMAIANGINRLRDSKATSKIIILLTDGVNNRGLIDPRSATELAIAEKIKVYTIGVGREGIFQQTIDDPRYGKRKVSVKSEIDEALLREIASKTGARYYAARNEKELTGIYDEIDHLEKSEVKSNIYYEYTEQFTWLAGLALFPLLFEWILRNRFLRSLHE
ncbi:MAG: VWA domain-containing protein [Nitrospinota bacterium]|nr:VWA domain-containing protein [Nitrospinota bacterium]